MKLPQLVIVTGVILILALTAGARDGDEFTGRPVAEALRLLQARGLVIVYSTALVTDEMLVENEPRETEPRRIALEILAPHGLTLDEGPDQQYIVIRRSEDGVAPGLLGSIVGRIELGDRDVPTSGIRITLDELGRMILVDPDGSFRFSNVPVGTYTLRAASSAADLPTVVKVSVAAGEVVPVVITLGSLSVFLNEIIITPSHFRILDQEPGSRVFLDHEQVAQMPHVADDLFRAVKRLPGTASGDYSAQFNVRGGEQEEVLVLLDGVEIYEPFHLKDFQNVFSIIDAETVGGVDFLTGGFPAEYGDRMSGVLDIRTAVPEGPPVTSVMLSTINARVASQGSINEGQGDWLVNVRAWYPSRVADLLRTTSPEILTDYYDAFARFRHDVFENSTLAVNGLFAYDDLGYKNEDFESEEIVKADYRSYQLWANLSTTWSPVLESATVLSWGEIRRRRSGVSWDVDDGRLVVDDRRDLEFVDFKQDWRFSWSEDHYLKWGFEAKRQQADYLYEQIEIPADPNDSGDASSRDDVLSPSGTSYGVYVADRFRVLESLVFELGLRWDKQFYVGSHQLSPRINVLYEVGPNTVLRAAWGRFHQSQRLNELQIEDGVTEFSPAQRSEHSSVSIEHRTTQAWAARFELFTKELSDLRPRYENLFDPLDLFPEVAPDRVRVAPQSGSVEGLELVIRRDRPEPSRGFDWWFSYGLSRAEDQIEGQDVPRSWDQLHSATFGLNWRFKRGWNLNLAGTFHTGWPTTPVTAEPFEDDNGSVEYELVVGDRNSERLPNYFRFDMRASRTFSLTQGELSIYLEIINFTNRENLCCFDDFEIVESPDGSVAVDSKETYWAPLIPSIGVGWAF